MSNTTRSDIIASSNAILATPNTASVVLGPTSLRQAKSKNLFYVRFKRPSVSTSTLWKEEIGFICKSVTKPNIQPEIDRLSQYGKKRIVHTGVSYDPITITAYDTTDGLSRQLWAEYAQYYFGAFNQSDSTVWKDDITSQDMAGASSGFGFKARPSGATESDSLNTQFFFDKIEIFELWGGMFIQTDLIHPKITSFEPDESDYEDNATAMVRFVFEYEGVMYKNGGKPLKIGEDAALKALFDGSHSGQVINIQGTTYDAERDAITKKSQNDASTTASQSGFVDPLSSITNTANTTPSNRQPVQTASTSGASVLSKFGNYNFGEGAGQPNYTQANMTGNTAAMTDGMFRKSAREINTTPVISNTGDGVSMSQAMYSVTNLNTDGTVQFGKNLVWPNIT